MTNVHRIEGGGTEFPMMVQNGSAGLGLILHEAGHNYVMGILANNEWREGFLDEGFTSFQTTWFMETRGAADRLPAERAHHPPLRPRRLVGTHQPGQRAVPGFPDLQRDDLQSRGALLPPAPHHRGRLHHAGRSCAPITSAGSSSMWTRRRSARWRRKCPKRDLSQFFGAVAAR